MGLLDKIFGVNQKEGKSPIQILSPAKGMLVELSEVSDETFAQEILGKGIALKPEEGKFFSPADGTLESMFPTGHAFSITTTEGVELLVHIGFDTVKLNGEHFTIHATEGQTVKKGDLLVEADLEQIVEAGYDITTPMVVLNTCDFADVEKAEGTVNPGDVVLTLTK